MKKGAYTGRNYLDEQYCALMFFIPDEYIMEFLLHHPNLKIREEKLEALWEDGILALTMDTLLEVYFASVLNYFTSTNISNELLELKMEELILNIFNQPEHRNLAVFWSSISSNSASTLRHILEENFASSMKLEEYAQLCNMSLSTFKREFKKLYEEPPATWLLRKKLDLAGSLLKHSQKTIGEISFQCGFENPSHFSRAFKNQFSITPQKYRGK
jgi:AraC-like DNA-binding protein